MEMGDDVVMEDTAYADLDPAAAVDFELLQLQQLLQFEPEQDELAQEGPELEDPKKEAEPAQQESDPEPALKVGQEEISLNYANHAGMDDTDMDDVEILENDIPESQLHAIEVHIEPPSNPHEYQILPKSWVVEKILDEIKVDDGDDEVWYSIEFDDGRVDQAAYDDVLDYDNGQSAVEKWRRDKAFGSGHASLWAGSSKRARPEDDYEDSSDSEPQSRGRNLTGLRRSTRQKTTSTHVSLEYDSDEDVVSAKCPRTRESGLGLNRRQTRASNAKTSYAPPELSDDELARQSSGDDFVPVKSDLAPHTRSSARKKKTRGRPRMSDFYRSNRDSSIEFEPSGARRSGRANRNTKSMRVPDVDDEYFAAANEDKTVKHVSVREIFQPLPEDSEFAKFHVPFCLTCMGKASNAKGSLIHCQGCSYSYHKICLGQRSARDHRVTKIGQDDFVLQCRLCIGTYQKRDPNAPKHAMCQKCKLDNACCAPFSIKKTPKQEEKLRLENGGEDPVTNVKPELINNAGDLLFRCTTCKRGFHFEHLPPMSAGEDIPEDLRAERLEEYEINDWKCKDCVEALLKIQSLVAWRPVDQESYLFGQTCLDLPEDEKEYLVKWAGRSHFHDTWMPGAWIFGVAAPAMRSSFGKREEVQYPKMKASDAIPEEWLLADVFLQVKYSRNPKQSSREKDLARISDVKDVKVKFQGLDYSEVVWDGRPPRDSGAPWNAFCAAYEEYVNGLWFEYVSDSKMKERIEQYRQLNFEKECELKTQPAGLQRGKLMEYQLEGVNWLLYNFHSRHNVVLADEMGLGKTIQVVSFITALVHDKPNCWPFLVVVPNATCPNWRRELKQWAPSLRVVTYHGGREAQQLSHHYELFPDGIKAGMKAHVVIMSYEAAVDAKAAFNSVKWAGLIVDEGQRLKNDRSLLYQALQEMRIPFRLLLTGTPLQNNKLELFNLLQFIDSSHVAKDLDEKYAELTKENIPELHSLIRPYFLRRTKAQVLKFLPPMAQIILPVTMTVLQEKLSKSIMSRNPELIKAIIQKSRVKAGERKSMNNMLMDLRQCLCHPFVFSQDVEDTSITDPAKVHQNLVEASSKLLLLSIMLPKLKQRGHRVLIFSQFLHSLTIIEDFLSGIALQYARIDGNLSALEKQKKIDAFNAPDSALFTMLLSTRAGGVGINLATADTVIIYDPDFNPHQDIQALSRAHRIGQKHKVLCFQLMTKNTVEEKIMQIGRKKMALDHALIESMDSQEDASDDLESILKHGAEALFSDDSKKAKIIYDEASVEKLLDRSQVESTDAGDDQSAESQFSFARVWANDEGDLTANVDDDGDAPASSTTWDNILKEREEQHRRELLAKQQEYGRGRRRGNQGVKYDVSRVSDPFWGLDDSDLLLTEPQTHDQDSANSDDGDDLYIDGNDGNEVEDESDNEGNQKAAMISPVKVPIRPPQIPMDPSYPSHPSHPSHPNPFPRDVHRQAEPAVKRPRGRPRKSASNEHIGRTPPGTGTISRLGPTSLTTAVSNKPSTTAPHLHQVPQVPQMPHIHHIPHVPHVPQNPYQIQRGASSHFAISVPGSTWQYGSMPHRSPKMPTVPRPPVKTNTLTTPQPSRPTPSGTAKSTPNTTTNGSVPCFICRQPHPHMTCVNFNSEMSLRLALDALRTSGADATFIQKTRETFQQRLRELRQKSCS